MILKVHKNKYKGYTVLLKCDWCGKEFTRPKCSLKQGKCHLCCKKCLGKWRSKTQKGWEISEKWAKRISKAKMGAKNPMYGKEVSAKTREKLRIASKKMWQNPDYRKKMIVKQKANRKKQLGKGKITKKNLRQRADKMWQRVILARANNCCEVCGSVGRLNAHHIVSRKSLHLRYDVRNGIALCVSHHVFGKESAHLNPIWFVGWLEENRPKILTYLKKERGVLEPSFDYGKAINDLKKVLFKYE